MNRWSAAWGILVALVLFCAASEGWAEEVSSSPASRRVALLEDPTFRRGVEVLAPEGGAKKVVGTLRPWDASDPPAWSLHQWHSRFDLAQTAAERLPNGSIRYANAGKAVTFGDAGDANLVLAVHGQEEYGRQLPAEGEAWPHLLVEQPLREHPHLVDLDALRFQLEYRISQHEPLPLPGWDERRHTAQLFFYLTIQNRAQESGRFDYYWFGLPLFDQRYRMPEAYAALDFSTAKKPGTGKFIYLPAAARLTPQSAHDGQWVRLDLDLLPLVHEGLKLAWERGQLAGSQEAADYALGTMNLGWEVTAPIDVVAEVRGLSLEAAVRSGR